MLYLIIKIKSNVLPLLRLLWHNVRYKMLLICLEAVHFIKTNLLIAKLRRHARSPHLRPRHDASILRWSELCPILVVKIVIVGTIALARAPLWFVECAASWFRDSLRSDRNGLLRLYLTVLTGDMAEQLVLTVVPIPTGNCSIANIRLVLDVPSLVVIPVSNGGEPFWAKLALVRFLPSVNPDVDLKIASLIKLFIADNFFTGFWISTDHLRTHKVLFLLLWSRQFCEAGNDFDRGRVLPFLLVEILAAELSQAEIRQVVIKLI